MSQYTDLNTRNNVIVNHLDSLKSEYKEITIEDKSEEKESIKTMCAQTIKEVDEINQKLSHIKTFKTLTGHILIHKDGKIIEVPVQNR